MKGMKNTESEPRPSHRPLKGANRELHVLGCMLLQLVLVEQL